MYPVHGECVNYRNGFCVLFRIPVNPALPACPHFRRRSYAVSQEAIGAQRRTRGELEPDVENLLKRLEEAEKKLKEIRLLLRKI
ncbi:hypothetical protein CW702_02320 [Candidatus Bathyarchaeota archaeon]|nr:MAG: hypothetical protein CW702_02320 [Candidatus Bathyarchaeota archaeon]